MVKGTEGDYYCLRSTEGNTILLVDRLGYEWIESPNRSESTTEAIHNAECGVNNKRLTAEVAEKKRKGRRERRDCFASPAMTPQSYFEYRISDCEFNHGFHGLKDKSDLSDPPDRTTKILPQRAQRKKRKGRRERPAEGTHLLPPLGRGDQRRWIPAPGLIPAGASSAGMTPKGEPEKIDPQERCRNKFGMTRSVASL